MGSLISLLRDIRTVYRDLKVTLKLTARIVLKVHSIVEDVEKTVQDLKAAVKGLSAKIQPEDGMGEVAFEALVESVETKAISLKSSLIEATSQVFNKDLVRNTQEKWDKVMQYSRQSSEALADIVANSSFNVIGHQVNDPQLTNTIEDTISLSRIGENELSNETNGNFNNDQALVPAFIDALPGITDDEEIRDFEILPLDSIDSFWKCDIGCFNIDCADFRQIPTTRQHGETSSHSKKNKTKKRIKKPSKSGKKATVSARSSGKPTSRELGQTPKYHQRNRRQPREKLALELIFLIAILYEGVAMSDNDLSVPGNAWNKTNRRSAAEIIELDD